MSSSGRRRSTSCRTEGRTPPVGTAVRWRFSPFVESESTQMGLCCVVLTCFYRVRLVSHAARARLRRLGLRPRAIFNGAHDVRPGVLRVHATARSIHIQLRVAVLRSPPRPESLRSAGGGETSRACHPVRVRRHDLRLSSGSSSRNRSQPLGLPRPASAICGAIRRRRDTAFLVSLASVGAVREPAARLSLLQSDSPSKPPVPRKRRVFFVPFLRVVGRSRLRLTSVG